MTPGGLAFLLGLAPGAHAAQKAGVTMADTVTVAGTPLVLNGMGLREAYFVDIYVAGLYLPQTTTSGAVAVEQDTPKRLVMHFVYSHVTRAQQIAAFQENLAKNPDAAAMGERLQQLYSLFEDMRAGDEVELEYQPGQGTTIRIKGRTRATVAGVDFMRVVWGFFVGPRPASAKLKAGLLGG